MFYQLSPDMVFDIALVLAVVAAVRGLRGISWIAKAPKAVGKTRLKVLAGIVSAALAVPFTLRATLTGFGYASPSALAGDWFARAFLAWLFSMGAFDWLKLAIPSIFSNPAAGPPAGGDVDVGNDHRLDS